MNRNSKTWPFDSLKSFNSSGYSYSPPLQRRKLSHSETLSRVGRFRNDASWKRCFLVWRKKTMLSENGDVIKIDTTGRQTIRPWVSKMADRRYQVAWVSRVDILKCACVKFIGHVQRVSKRFQNGYGVVVWTGENDTKTISVDANLFQNWAKELRFRLRTD